MAFEGKGKLWVNESENEKAPKWKGKITTLDGQEIKMAAWQNDDGSLYLSQDKPMES